MKARVIGLGQEVAGDDGVGPAVVRALLERDVPSEVEVHLAGEPTALIPLLETPDPVVLVDAVVGPAPGEVLSLGPEEVEARGLSPLSTHGVGVVEAIALARVLNPERISPRIRIVGVGILPPERSSMLALSPPVAAAVGHAVEVLLRELEGNDA